MTTDRSGSIDAGSASAIDALLGEYAFVLDWQDWGNWPELFVEDCYYAVFNRQNAQDDLPLGYMIDDCRARLVDRVKFITEVWAGTIEPYRTRHIVQRVSAKCLDDGLYEVLSNIVVTYTEHDEPSKILVTGHYRDLVRIEGDRAVFTSKTVYIDGTPARYLAYPL